MKRVVVLFFFMMAFLVSNSMCQAKYFQQYTYGLKLEVPDEWQCISQSNAVILAVFVAPEMQYTLNTLTIAHQPIPAHTLLADYVQDSINENKKIIRKYQFISQQLLYDNPYAPYYLVTYTWELSGDLKIFVMQMITCRFPEIIVVTCCSPADQAEYYRERFMEIFNHVAFVN